MQITVGKHYEDEGGNVGECYREYSTIKGSVSFMLLFDKETRNYKPNGVSLSENYKNLIKEVPTPDKLLAIEVDRWYQTDTNYIWECNYKQNNTYYLGGLSFTEAGISWDKKHKAIKEVPAPEERLYFSNKECQYENVSGGIYKPLDIKQVELYKLKCGKQCYLAGRYQQSRLNPYWVYYGMVENINSKFNWNEDGSCRDDRENDLFDIISKWED